MSFWDFLTGSDAKKRKKPNKSVRIARVRSIIDPTSNYAQTSGGTRYTGDGFNPPEYDFETIGQAEDTEAYVMQAHVKKLALMFKEGYEIYGEDQQSCEYIKKRLSQIERASSSSIWSLLVSIGHDLIRYSNSYVVKVRKEFDAKGRPVSGGMARTTPEGKKLDPIAAYFRLSPETVEIKRNKSTGKVERYRQIMPDGSRKEWPATDVIHFVFNRKGHFDVGTPTIVPVLDDIRALRRIEQNVEILVHQHLFPLYHYVVGTEDAPAQVFTDGESEVNQTRKELELLPAEGMLVTAERHEIRAIGAESHALKVEGYLEHFKRRIIAGMSMSAVDYGEGDTSNRATADNMSRLLIDNVKFYQQVLSDQIKTFMLDELLLESTFEGDKLSLDRAVFHRFNEIDIDRKIKIETHAALMYQSNMISQTEARSRMNLNPCKETDEQEFHIEKVEKNLMKEQARLTPKPAAISTATGSQGKTQKAKKATATKTRPSNQHGTKQGPEKRRSHITDATIKGHFDDLLTDVIELVERDGEKVNQNYVRQVILGAATAIKTDYETKITGAMRRGMRSVGYSGSDAEDLIERKVTPMKTSFDSHVDRLFRQLERLVDGILRVGGDKSEIRLAFGTLRYRTRFIDVTDLQRAENFGAGLGLNALGHDRGVSVQHSDEDDICKELDGTEVDLLALTIGDVPPYHPMCQCEIKAVEES